MAGLILPGGFRMAAVAQAQDAVPNDALPVVYLCTEGRPWELSDGAYVRITYEEAERRLSLGARRARRP